MVVQKLRGQQLHTQSNVEPVCNGGAMVLGRFQVQHLWEYRSPRDTQQTW